MNDLQSALHQHVPHVAENIRTVLISRNFIIRGAVARIFDGTRYVVSQADSLDDAEFSEISATEQVIFLLVATHDFSHFDGVVNGIKIRFARSKIVVLAATSDVAVMHKAMEAGISGYLEQTVTPDALVKTLDVIMNGGVVFPSASLKRFRAGISGSAAIPPSNTGQSAEECLPLHRGLTASESRILQALTHGDTNKAIGRKLEIAEATVKVHVKAILRKIGAHNRTQAAIWACKNRTITPADLADDEPRPLAGRYGSTAASRDTPPLQPVKRIGGPRPGQTSSDTVSACREFGDDLLAERSRLRAH